MTCYDYVLPAHGDSRFHWSQWKMKDHKMYFGYFHIQICFSSPLKYQENDGLCIHYRNRKLIECNILNSTLYSNSSQFVCFWQENKQWNMLNCRMCRQSLLLIKDPSTHQWCHFIVIILIALSSTCTYTHPNKSSNISAHTYMWNYKTKQ